MKLRDFLLFVTMPVWLPAAILSTVFVVVMGLPAVLYGSLMLIHSYGPIKLGLSVFGVLIGLSVASSLLRVARSNVTPALAPIASIECSRCRNMDPANMKGGKFSCTRCGFQNT